MPSPQVRTVSTNDNDHVCWAQRPVLEAKQMRARENVVFAPQDPDRGHYNGLTFPDLRRATADEIRWTTPKAEREWAVEYLCKQQEASFGLQGFSTKTSAAFAQSMRNDLRCKSSASLRANVVALGTEEIHSTEGGLVQPLAVFFRRFAAGQIKPPSLDLDRLAAKGKLDELFDAIPLAYKMAGLPTLGTAFGISDVLLGEEGSHGQYTPSSPKFIDPKVNYGSRTSIPLITRMAWNSVTKTALCAKTPYVPANMRCVTDIKSARVAIKNGICPIVSYREGNASERLEAAHEFGQRAFVTVRMNNGEGKLAHQILKAGGNLHIEVANANMVRVAERVRSLKQQYPSSFISVGNVGSAKGYWLCAEAGADMVKLGRAPGAGCTTAIETGLSPGQVTLAFECSMVQLYLLFFRGKDIPMCLDGGMSTPGHVIAGAALGAETFMFGSLMARVLESPAAVYRDLEDDLKRWIEYFGESSKRAHELDGREVAAGNQGVSGFLEQLGPMKVLIKKLNEGVRGGIADLRNRTLGHMVGSKHPYLLRTVALSTAKETGTRLEAPATLGKVEKEGRY